MIPYENISGNSGIVAYNTKEESITVQFKSGKYTVYTYTYESAGADAVEMMKSLAQQGHGLNSYISKNKPGYSGKH